MSKILGRLEPADPADAARAEDIKARADVLQERGWISDEQRRSAWNLGLLRKLVETAEYKSCLDCEHPSLGDPGGGEMCEKHAAEYEAENQRQKNAPDTEAADCTCAPALPDGRGAPCEFCAARAADTEIPF